MPRRPRVRGILGGLLAKLHIIPSRVDAMLTRMNTNVDSYIEAEKLGLLTLDWKLVAQSPSSQTG